MEIKRTHIRDNHSLLLSKFNERDHIAFGEVYSLLYNDIHSYTLHLYKNTDIDSDDIIQDIFLLIWEKRTMQFDDLIKIKGFVIIAIKNGYKNYLRHSKHTRRYAEEKQIEKDYEYDIISLELFSIVHEAIHLLPKDCADIFKLYLEGYKPEEIASITGKQPQTIYNKKQEAISILRRKLSKDKFILLLLLLNKSLLS